MRDFASTREPRGEVAARGATLAFVVQRHAASRLHYDLRLELDGVLKSWAVPKGPSLVVGEKRLAVQVEDHPLSYGSFEGAIPKGEYGGGWVFVWDAGTWTPIGDPAAGLAKGHLSFVLAGDRLRGRFALVRSKGGREGQRGWLLFKAKDEHAIAASEPDVTALAAPGAARSYEPELATLVDEPPRGEDWVVEPKLDGYRAIARLHDGGVEIASRSGAALTTSAPRVRDALRKLRVTSAVFDGELCALDADGVPRFEALQRALSKGGARGLIVYYAFDLLFVDGEDLRARPLRVRKAILASIVEGVDGALLDVPSAPAKDAKKLLEGARANDLEGLVAKRADRPYRAGRGRDWLKIKVTHRQEMVIVGTAPSRTNARAIGALHVAVRDGGELRYAGKVGTGFSAKSLADLERRLAPLTVDRPAAKDVGKQPGARWVEPELVAEVRFAEWTRSGKVRHASFVGLRDDKPASSVVRERPEITPAKKARPARAERAAKATKPRVATEPRVAVTHADRVIDHESGATKGDLARYVASVAARMLPYAAARPLALVRCPKGDEEACFFQKRRTPGMPASIRGAKVGAHEVLYVDDAEGLLALVQFGAVELHGWGARLPDVGRPDCIVMDLDPDEGLPFSRVVDAALAVRETLRALGLVSFVKTTGGKGLHVVAPIVADAPFADVKRFTHAVALRLAHEEPRAYTAVLSKGARKGKVFVDYLRNGDGATAVLPYSPRARPGVPVAWPIRWADVRHVHPAEITIANAARWLARKDAWAKYFETKQRIPDELRG
jgi:bifunctional non-homologous end joining protein LigD